MKNPDANDHLLLRRSTQLLLLVLATLLIANPLVVYLLSQSMLVALFSPIAVFLILYSGHTLIKTRKWILAYAVNFLLLVSILLHAEVVFRYVFHELVIEDLYALNNGYYFNKPYLDKELEDKEYVSHYRTNTQGFRIGTVNSPDILVGECDWLFLGDSYTQGAQVEFEDLFTTKLNRHFPCKIIVNAGVSGWGISDEYLFFRNAGKHLKPRKVFLQLCTFNDFMDVEERRASFSDYLMHYSDLARFLLYGLKYKQTDDLPLGRWTLPFFPSENENTDCNVFYKRTSARKDADIRALRQYIIELNKEVRSAGADLVIMIFPTKEQVYYEYLNEVVQKFRINVGDLDMDLPTKILRPLTDSLNICLIDLAPYYLRSPEKVFFDNDEHINSIGHEFTADIIASVIGQTDSSCRGVKLLSKDLAGDRYPSFCADGDSIIFQSIQEGHFELMIADSGLNGARRLTCDSVDKMHPSLSADGKRIAFTEGAENSSLTKVILMDLGDSSRRLITNDANEYGAIPFFSSDSNLIAYAQWFYDSSLTAFTLPRVYCADLKSGIGRTLTGASYESWRPVFSPDGNYLAYISNRGGNFDLYEMDLKTNGESKLTDTPYDEWDPRYSPSGARIVYAAKKSGNWDLFTYDRNKAAVTQLTNTLGNEWDPCFAPDGRSIVFGGEFGFVKGIYRYYLSGESIIKDKPKSSHVRTASR